MNTRLAGRSGEAKAAEYLRKNRYEILAAGYRCRFGEIDLIARKRELVVFVEVKLRHDAAFASAFEAVTAEKQRKIIATALHWAMVNKDQRPMRFDVIEVYTDTGKLNHIENAFQA